MRRAATKLLPSRIDDLFKFFSRLRMNSRNCCILESLDRTDPATGRYSIVGAIPSEELVSRDGTSWLVSLEGHRTSVDWRETLDAWCPIAVHRCASPLQTGAIGYIGYDAKYAFERFARRIPADTRVPDVRFIRYSAVLVRDHLLGVSTWAYEQQVESSVAELEDHWSSRWKDEVVARAKISLLTAVTPDFRIADHVSNVARTIEYVRAGDIFQANITNRFSATYEGDLYDCYAALRELTPNPFFGMLDFQEPLLSTSPERFFKIEEDRIVSCPIKGTARCMVDGVDQAERFSRSAKDIAENTMIVDLVRNDLGRVCRQGSIKVDALCKIKRFNQLYHMESIVSGRLAPGVALSKVIAAQFPGGSVTGAPKIRAVDIIEELEPFRRGPYCGAIGFLGSSGWVDLCVAIRVMYAEAGRLFLHAGGAIVVDSDPDAECSELFLKVEPLLDLLERHGTDACIPSVARA